MNSRQREDVPSINNFVQHKRYTRHLAQSRRARRTAGLNMECCLITRSPIAGPDGRPTTQDLVLDISLARKFLPERPLDQLVRL